MERLRKPFWQRECRESSQRRLWESEHAWQMRTSVEGIRQENSIATVAIPQRTRQKSDSIDLVLKVRQWWETATPSTKELPCRPNGDVARSFVIVGGRKNDRLASAGTAEQNGTVGLIVTEWHWT